MMATFEEQSEDFIQSVPRISFLNAAEFTMTYTGPYAERRHQNWLAELVIKGGFAVNVEHCGWKSRPKGTGILYSPGTRCRENADQNLSPNRPTTSLYMDFALDDDTVLYKAVESSNGFAWIDDPDGILKTLLEDVVQGFNSGVSIAMLHTVGTFYRIISLLAGARKQTDTLCISQMFSPLPDMILKANIYMQKNLAMPIRIHNMADYVGMSESGFSHAYSRITGRTPLTALRSFRFEAAKSMILRGNFTLQAIAEQTGFSDAFHLSRTFKSITGMSPIKYVKSLHS